MWHVCVRTDGRTDGRQEKVLHRSIAKLQVDMNHIFVTVTETSCTAA